LQGIVCGALEIPDRPLIITPLQKVAGQFGSSGAGLRPIGGFLPHAQPLMQAHTPAH